MNAFAAAAALAVAHAAAPGPAGGSAESSLEISQSSGFYTAPFEVTIRSGPALTVYYSTNGAEPSPELGHVWHNPLAVATTTTLRVAAYEGAMRRGPLQTRAYFFIRDILRQTGSGMPQAWGMTNGQPVAADYEMDPEIVDNPKYRGLLEPGLRSIPTVSVIMDPRDLFGAESGIYAHPMEAGAQWEKPASVEWIEASGAPAFQVQCGIRIQGGWNRRPEESPKHAFRLVFHKGSELKYPVFGAPGLKEFQTLILRAGCNNSWLHWSGEERRRGEYLRDQWVRDTFRAMGHPSAEGVFVHLYLNGLYWGLYNLCERPSAPFVAAHLGGSPRQYDVRNGDHILEGTGESWNQLLRLVNAGVAGSAEYVRVQQQLDLSEFIDYMLLNIYGGNGDWDRASNWYAARRHKPPGKFAFFIWDAERTLESVDANILDADDDQSPLRLFQKLRQNPEFRVEFARRAQQHLGEGGALSAKPAADRFRALASSIELAIIAESARWGDYRRDVHRYKTGPYELYTRDAHWQPEVDRLLREYFPQRTARVIAQLREAKLLREE